MLFRSEIMKLLDKTHLDLYIYLLFNNNIEIFLKNLLANGNLSIRLKAFEILKILCDYLTSGKIMGRNQISEEQLMLGKLILKTIDNITINDTYSEFNVQILLDTLFQYILPIPSFDLEVNKRICKIDDFTGDLTKISATTVNNSFYLHARLKEGLKQWPRISAALNSSWSNLRSVAYSVICSIMAIDINDYNEALKEIVKKNFISSLIELLNTKEGETKAGALNILGTFLGLAYNIDGICWQGGISG